MSSVSRTAFFLLVVFCAIGGSLPVMAALRDYGIYLGSIGGSTLLRLDNRIRENRGAETETNTLTSTTSISTKGFVWDPRFMTVDLNLSYSTSRTEADTYSTDADAIAFKFKSVLFPRWRYPYSPIRLSASKATRTVDSDGNASYESDFTRLSLSWGLAQKQLGRVRMRYSFSHEESTGDTRNRDYLRNDLQLNASKDFRKGKWGETHSGYGYHFDSFDDKILGNSNMQHNLFTNNKTKLGKKADLTSHAIFYQRYYDGRDDGISDDYFFSSSADLRVEQTERFQHNYKLGFVSDDDSNSYYGSANANYTYPHNFTKYLTGSASTGASARFSGGSDQDAATRFNANANGRLAYLRNYDDYRLSARYNMQVRSPTWGTGAASRGSQAKEVRINQGASLSLSRRNNPLYSDTATVRAQYEMAEQDSHSYSADYSASSSYQISNKASSLITGSASAASGSEGESSLRLGSSAILRYRFGRRVRASVNARQRWRRQGDDEYSLFGVRGLVSGQLYRRFNMRFNSELGWLRRVEKLGDGDDEPRDEIQGLAEVKSRMGKLVTSFRYTYREIDIDGNVSSDQSIMFEVKRFFGWSL